MNFQINRLSQTISAFGTEDEWSSIVNALRVAVTDYEKARAEMQRQGIPTLVAQFNKQIRDAEALIAEIEEGVGL